MVTVINVTRCVRTQLWCLVIVITLAMVLEVAALNGPNVCMVKQKYNITKRVKYRAPMSVRTYEWCMSIPPRCSKWSTEMRDLTRLETEERTAEVAVCCPGYKMKDVSCVPICPSGRTGHGCSQECPPNRWGPNCVNECKPCSEHGSCSPFTGECSCQDGWQGESCESRMSSSSTTTTTSIEELLTKKPATKPTPPSSATLSTSPKALVETTSVLTNKATTTITPIRSTSQSTFKTITSRTMTIQQTTMTPPTTPAENIASSENEGNIEHTSDIIELQSATIKLNISNTPIKTVSAASETIVTSTPAPFNTIVTDITLTNSNIKEKYITSILEENDKTIEGNIGKKNVHDNATFQVITTKPWKPTIAYNNITSTTNKAGVLEQATQTTEYFNFIYNRTAPTQDVKDYPKEVHVEIKSTPVKIIKTSDFANTTIFHKTTTLTNFTETPIVTTHATTMTDGTTKMDTTRRPDATIRYFPTTVKFKPKEIWIRPAQKGESFESKKTSESHTRYRIVTNKEPQNTTPKTIIVSIIPTSVSYVTYKRIALTTTSIIPRSTNMMFKVNSTDREITKPMSVLTTLLPPSSKTTTFLTSPAAHSTAKSVNTSKSNKHFHKVVKTISTLSNATAAWKNKTVPLNGTNSMATVNKNLNSSNFITPTVSSTNFVMTTHKANRTSHKLKETASHIERVTKPILKVVTVKPVSNAKPNITSQISKTDKANTNATKIEEVSNNKTNKVTTESPDDEETFHILTEPEHITAVMEGKEKHRTSVDLISVISIAGGIMMAVITVAVIIVMVERCKRPRYEDVRKMNDIHMQVMIDNNDVPPPYVRSIFHTPLPDPPTSDKCHYQPISTLDRNLKQFMRPVVVQTISPIMLENFRGILECHYDHLPRRNHEFDAKPKHCIISPSSGDVDELSCRRPCSIAESTIDALKCEAKLDVLDSTTSEPLYAEIPCWRPPSEHAIEIINYNGEAVTEL